MNSLPKVSVVILNWNGRKYLEHFLPSVISSSYGNKEIIVADNGSTDDSLAFMEKQYPEIRVISLDRNFGFARGYNEALKMVNADYYVLLNSDVEVEPGWIEPMVELLENDNKLAACQPKLLSYKHRDHFEYAGGAGGWLDRYGYPFARGRIFDISEVDKGQYDSAERIFWASGAALFIRPLVFHEMKGFDEYFFAHQEEIDLCWRMQLAGHEISSCPASVVYHVGGGTLPRGNSRKTYLNFRNNHIMLFKNLPWSQKWWRMPYRQLLDALSGWKGLISGDGGYFIAIIRAHMAFVKWLLFYRNKSVFPSKKNGRLHGMYQGNLVWEHFMKGKKYFSQIIQYKTGAEEPGPSKVYGKSL